MSILSLGSTSRFISSTSPAYSVCFAFTSVHSFICLFIFMFNPLPLTTSEMWCWSEGRGILIELSLCYSIVYHYNAAQWYGASIRGAFCNDALYKLTFTLLALTLLGLALCLPSAPSIFGLHGAVQGGPIMVNDTHTRRRRRIKNVPFVFRCSIRTG